MKFKKHELIKLHKDPEFIQKFEKLFCLHVFFDKGLYNKEFPLTEKVSNAIQLTKLGQEYFNKLKPSKDEEALLKFFLFVQFYQDDLYIDVLNTNISELEALLDKSIKSKNITYPWVHRKELYDKYFVDFEENFDILSSENTEKLLNNTYYGVFQVGEYISGPLGLKISESKRLLLPTKKVPLFHCPDPACRTLHKATLNDSSPPFATMAKHLSRFLPQEEPSEWLGYFVSIINQEDTFWDTSQINHIPKFIINCFDDSEIIKIFKYLVDNHKLRAEFPNIKRFKGAIEDIISRLNIAEIFQLILCKSTIDIIVSIEKLIQDKDILIPLTEIRKSPINYTSGAYDIFHECNQFGIRSSSKMPEFAILNLKKIITNLYSSSESEKQLQWILRHKSGESINEKIYNLLNEEKPDKIITEIIFNNPLNIEKLSSLLYGKFEIPKNIEEELLLKNRIIWKLGFDPRIHPHNLDFFWNAYDTFSSLIDHLEIISEKIEEVRAVSSNLFVALERLLENALSFITWILLNDHFIDTHFEFELSKAKKSMAETLNMKEYGGESVIFDLSGKNTLFPLTVGFKLLADVIEGLLLKKKEYKKISSEIPSFADEGSLQDFPFRHRLFFFDIRPSTQIKIISELKNITFSLEKSNIMGLRNKLQHNRENYPEKAEIKDSLLQLTQVIRNIEQLGYHPTSYIKNKTIIDEYKRTSIIYSDKKGKRVNVEISPEYRGCGLPLSDTVLIVPSIFMGETNEVMRFTSTENSNFKIMWSGYPKKRTKREKTDVEKITPSP